MRQTFQPRKIWSRFVGVLQGGGPTKAESNPSRGESGEVGRSVAPALCNVAQTRLLLVKAQSVDTPLYITARARTSCFLQSKRHHSRVRRSRS